jgi:SAM-dependent methyltransferase
MSTNKASPEWWDETWGGEPPAPAAPDQPVRQWLEQHLPRTTGASCFEVGCHPGRFLAVMGMLGYELNGIDMLPGAESISEWLERDGYRVGHIAQGDFFEYDAGRQFDVVMSLGFIEHFTDWERVLEHHIPLVAPGGRLVLEVPNMAGSIQNWFHRTFDRESYDHHHIPAMNPGAWSEILRGQGFDIEFEGSFGALYLWAGPQKRSLIQRGGVFTLRVAQKLARPFVPHGRHAYAPALGVIARRAG